MWYEELNIKQYLYNEEETPEVVLEVAKQIKAELQSTPTARVAFGTYPKKLVDKTQKAVDAGFEYQEVCSIFNGILNEIYDIADQQRIWLGF